MLNWGVPGLATSRQVESCEAEVVVAILLNPRRADPWSAAVTNTLAVTRRLLRKSEGRKLHFIQEYFKIYDIDAKVNVLGVDRSEAEATECVSETVAREMASGVRQLFGSDYGIAATGWAEPTPGKTVADPRAAIAVSWRDGERSQWVRRPGESRGQMIDHVVMEVLQLLVDVMGDETGTFGPVDEDGG